MAWTELSSTPGPLNSSAYVDGGVGVTSVASKVAGFGTAINTDPNYHEGPWPKNLLGGGPLNAPNLANTGWITLASYGGGGGGSTRPSSGFLYPRGDN